MLQSPRRKLARGVFVTCGVKCLLATKFTSSSNIRPHCTVGAVPPPMVRSEAYSIQYTKEGSDALQHRLVLPPKGHRASISRARLAHPVTYHLPEDWVGLSLPQAQARIETHGSQSTFRGPVQQPNNPLLQLATLLTGITRT